MPGIPTQPYDTALTVLQLAISISMDTASPAGILGEILNINKPGTLILLQATYRNLQEDLISAGVETYNKYGFIIGIPPANTPNPSNNVNITFTGYFDGQNSNANWYLMPDLAKPLELWERQSGNNVWLPMKQAPDSLETRVIVPRFGAWDFQTDTLWLPPSSQTNDLKFKYIAWAPDIVNLNSPILLIRCQTAFAYRLLMDASAGRGGLEMQAAWKAGYDRALGNIVNRSARKEAYMTVTPRPFRSSGRHRGRRSAR